MANRKASGGTICGDVYWPGASPVRRSCPLCGGSCERVTDGAVGRLVLPPFSTTETRPTVRLALVPFWACASCEFCEEAK